MWQITWSEYGQESFKPVGKFQVYNGLTHWFCPVCGEHVGITNDQSVHRERLEYRRSKCKNGHVIDWREVQ